MAGDVGDEAVIGGDGEAANEGGEGVEGGDDGFKEVDLSGLEKGEMVAMAYHDGWYLGRFINGLKDRKEGRVSFLRRNGSVVGCAKYMPSSSDTWNIELNQILMRKVEVVDNVIGRGYLASMMMWKGYSDSTRDM